MQSTELWKTKQNSSSISSLIKYIKNFRFWLIPQNHLKKKLFYDFSLKWARPEFHLNFFQMVGEWWDFTVVTKLIKHFKSLYGFWGCCLKIRYVCMDLKPYFNVHNLVSVYPKNIKLAQMTTLNVIFHVVVSDYQLVKL